MNLEFKTPTMEILSVSPCLRECSIKISGLTTSMGETMGNSIRRTLISSIPGTAPLAYDLSGATGEFSNVKGLLDGTTELGLKLKELKVAVAYKDSPTGEDGFPSMFCLKISKNYENECIKFGDFESSDPTVEIQVLNPDEELTYVGANKFVDLKVLMWTGVGYAKYDDVKASHGKEIEDNLGKDAITIDSKFSPVERVIFDVETDTPSKGLEVLNMTVTTDGSIAALTAISQASAIVSANAYMLQQCTNIIAKPYKFSVESAKCNVDTNRPKDFNMQTPVDMFGLSTGLYNDLKHIGINVMGDFNNITDPSGQLKTRMNEEILQIDPSIILPEHADKVYAAKITTVENLIEDDMLPEERDKLISELEEIGFKVHDKDEDLN